MAKGRNLSTAKDKMRKPIGKKTARRIVNDAATKAQNTEHQYDEKHGIFTK